MRLSRNAGCTPPPSGRFTAPEVEIENEMKMDVEKTRWWWIRHAPVPSDGKLYGSQDWPADCEDPELFRGVAAMLPRDAYWVTSHLQRTHQTAAALKRHILEESAELAEHPEQEPLLGEQSFGDWQGRTRREVLQELHDSNRWHRFWLTAAHEVPPGGESFLDLCGRVKQAVERISEQRRGQDIVAVAHGGTIRAALCLALDLTPERALAFKIDNVSLTRIDLVHGPAGGHAPEPGAVWTVELVNFPPQMPSR